MLFAGCAEDLINGVDKNYNPATHFGSDSTFEVITWNIENFAKEGNVTVDSLVSFINLLNPDVLCLQEIESADYFQELVNHLENYNGHRENSASYDLDLAVLYLNDLSVISIDEIYTDDWWSFPRSPQIIRLNWKNHEIKLINNHLKANCSSAYSNCNNEENQSRRRSGMEYLDIYTKHYLDSSNVIILGDLNDSIDDPENDNVFMNFLLKPAEYLFVDTYIAYGSPDYWSFPTWPSHLDHILITNELFDEFESLGSVVQTFRIEDYMEGGWNTYEQNISDHRPVGLKLIFKP